MATLQRYAPAGVQNPNEANVRSFPEAATQTFKTGDWVTLVSGKVTIIKAAGNDLGASDDILGMALQDASGTTNTKISVYVFDAKTIQRMNIYHATPGSAITALSDHGVAYGLRNHTGNIPVVNKADTTATKGRIVGYDETFVIGEQYGPVDFMFDPAQLIYPGT